jgi:hypothetical protein
VDQLAGLTLDYGFDGYIFGPSAEVEAQLERFAGEVAPRVRAAVERRQAALP